MPAESRRVAVIFGGPSPEHDVSILTGLQATHELATMVGPDLVRAIYWTKRGEFLSVDPAAEAAAFVEGSVPGAVPLELRIGEDAGFSQRKGRFGSGRESLAFDVAIVCCHGGPGEDGSLQGALDLAGITYAGPSAAGAALGMDKLATTGVLLHQAVRMLPRAALDEGLQTVEFAGPYIVKPRFGGSSIGIDVVADLETARHRLSSNVHLRQGAVIEPYRGDLFDLQVAVRRWPTLELSGIERPIRRTAGAEILDYTDKYVGGEGMDAAPREIPAEIPDKLAEELRAAAAIAAELCSVRGIARIDFLSDGVDELYLNEINTIPGSLARHLFVEPRRSFAELLEALIDEAVARPSAHLSAAGADGTVLRSAGSIAGKLG